MTWAETVPSNASVVGDFPNFAKSIWTTISRGMAVEHYWPASGGASNASIGDLQPGASRAFFAAQSASSAPSQATGRAFFASDASRLFWYTSDRTVLGGTPFYDEVGFSVGEGYAGRASGSFSTTATSGQTVINTGGIHGVTPAIYVSCSSAVILVARDGVSALTFQSRWSALAATGGSAFTLYWESFGTALSNTF